MQGSMTRPPSRRHTLLLALLLSALAVSSLVTILRDNRPLVFDPAENLVSAVLLQQALGSLAPADHRRWVRHMGFRPPLPAIVSLPAVALISDHVVAIRVTDLAFLLLCVWMIYRLGARLSGPAAGLGAALLFAAFPLVQSWGRMGNGDPVIWFTLLLLFRITLELDLRSRWQATALGLAVGLCMLTRLLALVFLVGPALWIALFKVRQRRTLLHLVAAGVWAAAAAGWWYLLKLDAISFNLRTSASRLSAAAPADTSAAGYLHLYPWLFGVVVVAAIVAWRRRLLSREHLALFGLWIGAAAAQLVLVWDFWERYPLALLPQCALLVAVVTDRALRDLPRWRAPAWLALALLALVPLAYWHLSDEPWRRSGLFLADTRPYDGMERALAAVPPPGPALLINEVYNRSFALGRFLARGDRRRVIIDAFDPHLQTSVRHVIRVTEREPVPGADELWRELCRRARPQPVLETRDPDGMEYHVARLPRPLDLGELR